MEDFSTRVAFEAKKKLSVGRKFSGVCLDGIGEFEDRNDFDGAVQHAIDETLYWDGDWMGKKQ